MRRYIGLAAVAGGLFAAPLVHAATFETAACTVQVAEDERIDCGRLTVPENRKTPGSRTITLPVMIFRAKTATPSAEPVIFLPGGPGASATRQTSGKNNPFLDDRDYILLEPRGATYASTHLECPQINAIKGQIAAGRLKGQADTALTAAAADCRKAWDSRGVDLDGYTSAETAADMEDLRQALGIRSWHVSGHSYGTRLALTYLRDYPQGVRSVMLDSTLPPEVHFDEAATQNLKDALGLVFAGCARTQSCHAAYPNVEKHFYALVRQADAHPVTLADVMGSDGQPVVAGGAEVVDAIYAALHDPDRIGTIPAIIEHALAGKRAALDGLIRDNQGPSGFIWGLRLSVWCSEEMPFEDEAKVSDQTAAHWGLGGIDERTASKAMCRAWNVKPAAAIENRPVESNVPVLVLVGEYDPDTAPKWSHALKARLPNARIVVMPGRSHGAGFNRCGGSMQPAFLRNPEAELDTTCVNGLSPANFEVRP